MTLKTRKKKQMTIKQAGSEKIQIYSNSITNSPYKLIIPNEKSSVYASPK